MLIDNYKLRMYGQKSDIRTAILSHATPYRTDTTQTWNVNFAF